MNQMHILISQAASKRVAFLNVELNYLAIELDAAGRVVWVISQVLIVEIRCRAVCKLVSSFVDEELEPELRARLMAHLSNCKHCTALVDGTTNVLRLVADGRSLELPPGFSERLRKSLEKIGRRLHTIRPSSILEVEERSSTATSSG